MGYGGRTEEREQARALRAQAWTLAEIAAAIGVARSTVSLWVRDVEFVPRPRNRGNGVTRPHPQHLAKLAEIDAARREGIARIGELSANARLVAGAALYAGEGAKRDGLVAFTNTDPRIVRFFCDWLRNSFQIDESRLRARLHLHEDLDLPAATAFWSAATGIAPTAFHQPHRPAPGPGRRANRHAHGCVTVRYHCATTHRRIIGLCDALLR